MYTISYIINDVDLCMHSLGVEATGYTVCSVTWNETFLLLEPLQLLRQKVCYMNKMLVHLEIFNRLYSQFCATEMDASRRGDVVG